MIHEGVAPPQPPLGALVGAVGPQGLRPGIRRFNSRPACARHPRQLGRGVPPLWGRRSRTIPRCRAHGFAGRTPDPMTMPPAKSHGRKSISASSVPRSLMDGPPRLNRAWTARVLTLFPESFPGVLGASLTGKALSEGRWALETLPLRGFGLGKHRKVDDTPAGGGAGLVMRADVLGPALDEAAIGTPDDPKLWPRVYLSPRGRPFRQADAAAWAGAQGVTLLCGRFEGVDQRVIDHHGLEESLAGGFRPDRRRNCRAGDAGCHGPADPRGARQCRLDRGGELCRRAARASAIHPAAALAGP